MFKTHNNQSTLANQQLLDEIELMSGQEMVELSGQELMNVVGGGNGNTEDPDLVYAEPVKGIEFGIDPLIQPQVKVENGKVTIVPDTQV